MLVYVHMQTDIFGSCFAIGEIRIVRLRQGVKNVSQDPCVLFHSVALHPGFNHKNMAYVNNP